MSTVATGWRVWLIAGLSGSALIVALLALFKVPPDPTHPETPVVKEPRAQVELAWNALLAEEAVLRDPTPLFLPTRWNVVEDALAMNAPRELGGAFQDYPPKWSFAEAGLKLELRPVVQVPQNAAEALASAEVERPFEGFGQFENAVEPLTERGGFIQVASSQDGNVVLKQPLLTSRPPVDVPWQPLEFLVAVDRSGLVGSAVLTESSRVPAVDSYFREFLINSLRIGERLDPGFYRINIGP
jgi:hypothetical protein